MSREPTVPPGRAGSVGSVGKDGALEGLRGLASFCVVLHHLACALFPALIFGSVAVSHHGWDLWLHEQLLLGVAFQGNFMVCVFFVLSGYVLSYRYIQTGDRGHLWSGLVRRYPRLMLPAVASCVLAWAVLTMGLFHNIPAARVTGSSMWLATWWDYPGNLLDAVHEGAISAFSNGPVVYNSALWTMWNELLGSLLVYVSLLLIPRRSLRWVAYPVLAVVTVLGSHTYLLAFVLGMAFCELMAVPVGDEVRRVVGRGWWVVLVVVGLFLGGVPIPGQTMAHGYANLLALSSLPTLEMWVLLHVIGAACIVMAVLGSPRLRVGLETRPLRWLGRTSFGLYLVHMVVIGTVASWLVLVLAPRVGYLPAAVVASVATIVVSLGMAELFTRWVDAPTIALTGRWYRSLRARQRAGRQIVVIVGPSDTSNAPYRR